MTYVVAEPCIGCKYTDCVSVCPVDVGGCFWCVEAVFEEIDGVRVARSGYAGGSRGSAHYGQVGSGGTRHAEAVQVIYDPHKVSYEDLLQLFWESHDPTQGMRQGNDRGSQYRSGIYTLSPNQTQAAQASKARYQQGLKTAGYGTITTEIKPAGDYYYAEQDHQQYLAKNINGYCGLGGTGVGCPALDAD